MKTQDLFDVAGLSVLITGGAKGLGRAFAEALLDNGARVTLLDCDGECLDRAVIELRDRGTAVHGDVVDVTDRAAMMKAVDRTVDRLGRLDVVFANAGIDAGPGFLSMSGERDP
ncbi:MAG TPA: SDR family NAD(P)-dependent oxidoreductase, partial [Bradyrhizobium sp.]